MAGGVFLAGPMAVVSFLAGVAVVSLAGTAAWGATLAGDAGVAWGATLAGDAGVAWGATLAAEVSVAWGATLAAEVSVARLHWVPR